MTDQVSQQRKIWLLVIALLWSIALFFLISFLYGVWQNARNPGSVPNYKFQCRRGHVDTKTGSLFMPNCSGLWQRYIGQTLPASRFTTNAYGWRTVPYMGQKRRPVLFFGDSSVLGFESDDGQTMPYQFAKNSPTFAAYNFGIEGAGIQHMLALLEEKDLKSQIREKGRPVLVYSLNDIHFHRVIGDWMGIYAFGADFPCYQLAANGELMRRGNFGQCYRTRMLFFYLLGKNRLLWDLYSRLHQDELGEKDIDLSLALFIEAKRVFKEKFGSDEFYVMLWPYTNLDVSKSIASRLQAAGVGWLDLSRAPASQEPLTRSDGHPTPYAEKLVGERLAEALSEKRVNERGDHRSHLRQDHHAHQKKKSDE